MFNFNYDNFLKNIISKYLNNIAEHNSISYRKLKKIPKGMRKDYYEDVSLVYIPFDK